MKRLLPLVLVLSLINTVFAEPIKVVYHINDTDKIHLLISSVREFQKSVTQSHIEVVVQGPAVLRLGNTSSVADEVKELLENNVKIGACSTSMRKNKLPPGILVPGIEVLKQGAIARVVELQQQGSAYIKI